MSEFLSLFLVFMRIDLVGFGGGYAMLPLIFESVREFDMISRAEFADLVALSQITPGPIAINAATYVGFKTLGVAGAGVATLGIIVPSFALVYTVAHFLERFKQSTVIESVFTGIRPATVGLIGAALIYICEASVFNAGFSIENIIRMSYHYIEPVGFILLIAAAIFNGKFRVNPLVITLLGGIAGMFLLG